MMTIRFILAGCLTLLLFTRVPSIASAQENRPIRTSTEIIDALSPSLSKGLRVEGSQPANTQAAIDLSFHFLYDSIELADEFSRRQLQEVGLALKQLLQRGVQIELAGYTDGVGSQDYNLQLSERRADHIYRLLCENYQLPADSLVPRGYGKDKPVATNETEEGRALNRRVVLRRLK